jgi:hypothetical protein
LATEPDRRHSDRQCEQIENDDQQAVAKNRLCAVVELGVLSRVSRVIITPQNHEPMGTATPQQIPTVKKVYDTPPLPEKP